MHTGAVGRADIRTQAVTVHLAVDTYRLLKSYSSLSERSMSEVIAAAVQDHLAVHATGKTMAALVEEHRAALRGAKDKR